MTVVLWCLLGAVSGRGAEVEFPGNGLEQNVPHADLIGGWNGESFARGEKLYLGICIACHGTPQQPGSLPTSRAFWREPFKNGNDPFSIYKTLTLGLGQMPAWPFLSPQQKYDVIHYVRDALVKPNNPEAYYAVTREYLAGLPKPRRKFEKTAAMVEFEKGPKYLRMDFGPVMFWTLGIESNNIAYKGIAIRLDAGPGGISKGRAWMVYDHDTMRLAAAWTGNRFIDWKGIAFDGAHQVFASIVGDKAFSNPVRPGCADPASGGFEDPRLRGLDGKPYGPLPRAWAHYRGTYLGTNRVVISYTVGETEILESPGWDPSQNVFNRTFHIGKSSREVVLRLCPTSAPAMLTAKSEARVVPSDGFWILRIPAASTPIDLQVLLGHEGDTFSPERQEILAQTAGSPEELVPLTQAGPRRWPVEIVTTRSPTTNAGPFTVEQLAGPPEEINPYHAWMRLSGLDFFKNGTRAAVCTWNGDVWEVSGLAGESKVLTWKRIATGLFQPLGLKIVDEQIYISCRDQIVRLRDFNGDGETDFYENFNSDHQVTEHFHEFAAGLQTDAAGNFYYAKCARHALPALVPQHGTLLKVSADGLKTEILASGFRAINGLWVEEDGTFFATDQEGHWTPKNRINWVRPGRFYGNMYAYTHPESSDDSQMEQPLVWITNDMDRSPGEIVRIPAGNWGRLGGMLLNLSYGMGRIFLVPYENVNGQLQGGVVQLPLPDFGTGIMRGRFHPGTGDLYACGLVGWASNQQQDGGLYRVHYNQKSCYLPVRLHAARGLMDLEFSDVLQPESIQATNFAVKIWGLRRSADYGSPHLNEHPLKVVRATLAKDGKTVRLEVPELQATWGMEIRCEFRGADGSEVRRVIHNTIHELGAE